MATTSQQKESLKTVQFRECFLRDYVEMMETLCMVLGIDVKVMFVHVSSIQFDFSLVSVLLLNVFDQLAAFHRNTPMTIARQ